MRPRTSLPPLPPGTPTPPRHPWRSLARAASWHRRKLAVLAACATVLTGLAAAAPPAPAEVTVVRTRSALPGGVLVAAADVEAVPLAEGSVPDDALTSVADLIGRRLAAPLSRHQVVTGAALVSARTVSGPGRVLAPVRLADADVVALLRPGEAVDVVATDVQAGRSSTVARDARVVTVPAPVEGATTGGNGALVVLEVGRAEVEPLTRAMAGGTLTVVWA